MDIERAELLVTLKGVKVWKKGTIFDPEKDGHPIPSDVIAEVRAKTGKVRVLKAVTESPSAARLATATEQVEAGADLAVTKQKIIEAEAKLAGLKVDIAETEAKLLETSDVKDEEAPLTGAALLRMKTGEILDLLKDEKDFESLKGEKRTVLVGIARKRFVKENDQS